jgi:hypothetical protein
MNGGIGVSLVDPDLTDIINSTADFTDEQVRMRILVYWDYTETAYHSSDLYYKISFDNVKLVDKDGSEYSLDFEDVLNTRQAITRFLMQSFTIPSTMCMISR